MRRQTLGNDEILNSLLAELEVSTKKARATLDRTLARLNESQMQLPEIEAVARERAKADFAALDPALIAQLIQSGSEE
jgi:uncharacterized coiled-coil protein SlyX